MKRKVLVLILLLAVVAVGVGYMLTSRARKVVMTGIVTTDTVIVSSEVQGRLQQLLVKEGDSVKRGDLIARIQPQEQRADMSFYAHSERQWQAQVVEGKAELKYQEAQTTNQIRQAEANLAAAQAQVVQATADFENTRLNFNRLEGLYRQGVESAQVNDQSRTTYEAAKARVESLRKQVEAAEAGVALAKANAEQTAARRAALEALEHQVAAAGAQKERAQVRLDYTEIRAPISGTVDLRAALQGEVVNPGQAIVTLKLKASVPGKNILEVSFSEVPAGWLETLKALPEVADVKADEHTFRILSDNGPRTTVEVMETARKAGVAVASLSVQSTTLDDVFVHYTGHQLRDALQRPAGYSIGHMYERK